MLLLQLQLNGRTLPALPLPCLGLVEGVTLFAARAPTLSGRHRLTCLEPSDGQRGGDSGPRAGRDILLLRPEIPPISPKLGRLGLRGLTVCPWTERREWESDLVDPRFAVEVVNSGVVPPECSVLGNASAVGAEPLSRTEGRSWNVN